MTNEGQVRRVDLFLRAKYIDINTTIYKINNDEYKLYCENVDQNFDDFLKDFEYSIRVIGTPVCVTNKVPEVFETIISQISDKEIAQNFEGMPMTAIDFLNVLMGKFPEEYFYKIETTAAGKVNIRMYTLKETKGDTTHMRFLSPENRRKIQSFLDGMKLPIEFEIIEDELTEHPNVNEFTLHNPVQYIYSNNYRRNQMPDFSKRDEALWFDKIDDIFQGNFTKDDLYFFNTNDYACYVDYSSFGNIDLRNHLFLFPTVYITLPYEKNISDWLGTMRIKPDEFLELVKKDRLKVIMTQPEFRYDLDFFIEIYKANPNAVITRRALAALQQIDIVEISDNYILNDINVIRELKQFCEIASNVTKIQAKFMYETLVWPIRARRQSFQGLHYSGLIGVPSFGVNHAIEKSISTVANRDLSFEFMISSSSVHLANALNATYFPYNNPDGFTDFHFANIMGEYLNFYRNATPTKIKDFLENRQVLNRGIMPISPIDVIELNEYIPVTELEKTLSKDVIFPQSKHLMEHLANLTPEERKIKIEHYNSEVQKKINKSGKHSQVIDLGYNVLMDGVGAYTGFSALGSAFTLLKMGGNKIKQSIPGMKNLDNKINEALHNDVDKLNIHYLTKINRVARVKRF